MRILGPDHPPREGAYPPRRGAYAAVTQRRSAVLLTGPDAILLHNPPQ